MQTVILAGGLGTRIRDVAGDLPKALLPVGGRPFVDLQLDLLTRAGLNKVVFCLGLGAELIENHLGDGRERGFQIQYAHEDPAALMGTGGAILNAWDLLDEQFLVLYGDSYLPIDYRQVADAFDRAFTPALMTVFRNRGRWDPSNVRIQDDRVVYYRKGAPPGEADCIDYGLSAYRRDVFVPYREASLPLDLGHIQATLVEAGQMAALEVHERFYEIGKPEGLSEMRALFAD